MNPRTVTIAIRVVGALVVLTLGFIAFQMVMNRTTQQGDALALRAAANLEELVRANPENIELRLRYAEALAAAGRLRQAVDQYNEVLAAIEDHPVALTGLGLVAMQEERWELAEGYWNRVIQTLSSGQYSGIDRRLSSAYHYLGLTFIEKRQYEEAIEALRQSLRIHRAASDTHYALSVAYREVGSEHNQRESLQMALTYDPTMPEANYDYALLMIADGDEAAAAEFLRRSVDNAPADRREPARELRKLGPFDERFEAARDLFESDPAESLVNARIAVALEPRNVEALRLLAQAYEKNGQDRDALTAWGWVLDIVPTDDEATQAQDRLSAE